MIQVKSFLNNKVSNKITLNYLFEISTTISKLTLYSNFILFFLWELDFVLVSTISLFFNALFHPLLLIIITKNIDKKYAINGWVVKSILFSIICMSSIFLGLLNWIINLDGRHNIDNGTWMIINLEMLSALSILLIYFLINLLNYIFKRIRKRIVM